MRAHMGNFQNSIAYLVNLIIESGFVATNLLGNIKIQYHSKDSHNMQDNDYKQALSMG